MTSTENNREIITFCQMLSLALKSGRSLPESLLALSGRRPENKASQWCREIGQKMSSGYSAQEACSELADFDPVMARLLPLLGDDRLGKVLDFYTRCLINLGIVQEKLKAAFFYPFLVITVLVANLVYLNIYLFPQVFIDMGSSVRSLPIMVRLLHFTEVNLWPLSLILPLLIFGSLVMIIKTSFGTIDSNSVIARIYGAAAAVRLQETARLQSLVSLYLKAGLSLEESVKNSAKLAGKSDAADLTSAGNVLSQGHPPEEAFAYSNVFMEIAHAELTPELYAEKLAYASESNYRNSCALMKNSSEFMAVAALLMTGFFVAIVTSGVFDTYYWLMWMFQ